MSETLTGLVSDYGLLAIFVGCLAEGESAAMLAGFFAHQGVFNPWAAFLVTFFGAWLGDTIFFLIGRRYSDHPFVGWLRGKPGFGQALRLIDRHPNAFVLTNRFIYGMRLAGGVAAGTSRIPVVRFLLLNGISALVWATLFGSLGYFLGLGAEKLIGDALKTHQTLIIGVAGGIVLALLAIWIARRIRHPAA